MTVTTGIERRIFVVGVPRSGTTLVQSLLAAHSSVTSFTESHFFSRHFTLLPFSSTPVLTKNPAPRVREFIAENGESEPATAASIAAIEDGAATRPRLAVRTRETARQLLQLLDELCLARGSASWVEKTPKHLRYIPFLQRLTGKAGRASFVHVIRRGHDVVRSLQKASKRWERPYDLDACIARWNRDLLFSLGRLYARSDQFVFYEELTNHPEQASRRLFSELGLDWEPKILERYGNASGALVTQGETWKRDVGRPIHPSPATEPGWTAQERERVRNALRSELYDTLRERSDRRRS